MTMFTEEKTTSGAAGRFPDPVELRYNIRAEANETECRKLRHFWPNLIFSSIVQLVRFADVNTSGLASATSQADRTFFIGFDTKQKATGVMVDRLHLWPKKDCLVSLSFIVRDGDSAVKPSPIQNQIRSSIGGCACLSSSRLAAVFALVGGAA